VADVDTGDTGREFDVRDVYISNVDVGSLTDVVDVELS
jgi:hypothetical protein